MSFGASKRINFIMQGYSQ